MKKIILAVLLLIGMSFVAKASPICITNIIVSYTQPNGSASVTGTTNYDSHISGTIEGIGLLADNCTNGPSITLSAGSCVPIGTLVAIVSWECTEACGGGTGSFLVNMPTQASAVTIRIFVNGTCSLGYCVDSISPCSIPRD
jgi:hypothetical protein